MGIPGGVRGCVCVALYVSELSTRTSTFCSVILTLGWGRLICV